MPEDLPNRLGRFLKAATGETWRISAEAPVGEQSLAERRKAEMARQKAEIAAHPFVAEALAAFPGARITTVRRLPPVGETAKIVPLRSAEADPTQDDDE
jgi:DNA polymerase-3 subunit gamma/tau